MRISTLSLIGLLGAVAIGAACYDPSLQNGGLVCGGSSGAECPEGHFCSVGYCYKNGTPVNPTAGASGGGNSGGGGRGGAAGGGGGIYGPFPGCMQDIPAGAGRCDAVCQAGCNANERCNLENGTPLCRAQQPPFRNTFESCGAQGDNCRPGNICLEEVRPQECGMNCYRYCRDDSHCPPNTKCASEVLNTTQKVCSPPFDPPCNPVATGGNLARCPSARAGFGCYVLSSRYPDLAVCDCAGSTGPNETCRDEHECVPGWECVKLGNEAICRKVCNLTPPSGCGGTQVCVPFLNGTTPSNKFGFCRPPL